MRVTTSPTFWRVNAALFRHSVFDLGTGHPELSAPSEVEGAVQIGIATAPVPTFTIVGTVLRQHGTVGEVVYEAYEPHIRKCVYAATATRS